MYRLFICETYATSGFGFYCFVSEKKRQFPWLRVEKYISIAPTLWYITQIIQYAIHVKRNMILLVEGARMATY